MGKITFEPADGYTRVELSVQHLDTVVVVDGTFETDDPALQLELEAHPALRRADTKPRKGGDDA